MPYNNTPITPSKEITGTVALPLARVKKIIATDDDISNCSNNASFVITVAAEMFLQHLVEQSYNIVKSERKPRRNIQYRDVASAVSRVENLEFLTDVVPKTTTYRQHKLKQKQQAEQPETAETEAEGASNGPTAGTNPFTLAQRPTSSGGRSIEYVVPELKPQPRPPPAPQADVQAEVQATNGASHHDAMDVDGDEEIGNMHTADVGVTESVALEDEEGRMEVGS